jgi:hypothetical protein
VKRVTKSDSVSPKKDIANVGGRFPGVKDSDLIQVKVGSVKQGSTKITKTTFILPKKK